MVGLSIEMVIRIVEPGLPLTANVAGGDPAVSRAMDAQSITYKPGATGTLYAKLGKDAQGSAGAGR